jgi:hypothetical protein
MWSEETRDGIRYYRWGNEVQATSPAKHGDLDSLVAFNGTVWDDFSIWPTNQAMLFGLGFIGLAQWECFQARKRDELWIGDWTDKALQAMHPDDIRAVVENNFLAWEKHRAGRNR